MAYGDISAILGTLEFEDAANMDRSPVYMQGDVVAIAYRNPSNVGQITTISVGATGNFGGILDTAQFDTFGAWPHAIRISDTVIAIWYAGPDVDGWLRTMTINTDGTIGATIDTLEFETVSIANDLYPLHLGGNYYAVTYQGPDDDGWIKTMSIDSSGNISAVIDSYEFESTYGVPRAFINISGTVRAITYRDADLDGWLLTLDINADGTIPAAPDPVLDSWEFEPTQAIAPTIFHITGTEYLLSYIDTDTDGWIKTVTIADDGTITKSFNVTLEYETAETSGLFSLLSLGANDDGDIVIAFAYSNPTSTGNIRTYKIAPDGTAITAIDTLSTAGAGTQPVLLNRDGDYYILVYGDVDADGMAITFTILTPPPPTPIAPTVATLSATAITATTATGNGIIADLGEPASVTEHGHCWATSIDPTTADSKTTNGAGSLGAFISSITGLVDDQVYFVRAYATNATGTDYGANVTFRAGSPGSQLIRGNLTIKQTRLHYVDADGKERWLEGALIQE